jgi:hypothetical protein
MKTRLLLYFLAGCATALAIILWPTETTPYNIAERATKSATTDADVVTPELDAELTAILEASERGEELRALLAETPDA